MKRVAILALLVAILVSGCGPIGSPDGVDADTRMPSLTIQTGDGEGVEVWVEIADEQEEQRQGLMNRTELPEDQGMLFVYPREDRLSFWMRDTTLPLSIAFIDSEGRIADIQQMEPLDDEPPHYTSSVPVLYALEVNQGFFEERGVEVGDTVELPG